MQDSAEMSGNVMKCHVNNPITVALFPSNHYAITAEVQISCSELILRKHY